MRNRKSLLSLGILALVLVLGVGYAAISGIELNINGTATAFDKEIEVYFKEVAETDSVDELAVIANGEIELGDDGVAQTGDERNATISVEDLEVVGDWATVTYTVANANKDLEAVVKANVVSILSAQGENLDEFYQVTFDPEEVTIGTSTDGTTATAATKDITVKVTLIKVPITLDESTANISIRLDVTPVQPGSGSSD